jgi:putative NADH-flavin reductase
MSFATRHVLYVIFVSVAGLTSMSLRAATIVVYGASAPIGGLIVTEALSRGDTVIGVSRDPSKLKFEDKNFKAVPGDVTDLGSFAALTKGADAVIISVGGVGKDNEPEHTSQAMAAKVAVQAFSDMPQKSPHVIQIGGATTMYETKEAMVAHIPFQPGSEPYAMVLGHLDELQTYRASKIRWTVLTPPLKIEGHNIGAPPEPNRTGKYRTSTTDFVKDANGESRANIADLAVAAVDEAEHPHFIGKRFTIGY